LIKITNLLNEAQIVKLKEILSSATFIDGKLNVGKVAKRVKENEEIQQEPEIMQRLQRIIMSSIAHNSEFRNAALPNRMADFIFARYQPGMHYGDHVDDPIMGGGKLRTDISMTIFLNEPKEYEGGELTVTTPFGDQKVKLNAGDAVIYPSSSTHRVAEVTQGERLVALTWIQSFVKDSAKRDLLYELNLVRENLLENSPETDQSKIIDRSYVNLLRMWADL
tara:strand:+ start:152 stop:817 length:666 start_codon:yes stop_codon:yes gene_type:complete